MPRPGGRNVCGQFKTARRCVWRGNSNKEIWSRRSGGLEFPVGPCRDFEFFLHELEKPSGGSTLEKGLALIYICPGELWLLF